MVYFLTLSAVSQCTGSHMGDAFLVLSRFSSAFTNHWGHLSMGPSLSEQRRHLPLLTVFYRLHPCYLKYGVYFALKHGCESIQCVISFRVSLRGYLLSIREAYHQVLLISSSVNFSLFGIVNVYLLWKHIGPHAFFTLRDEMAIFACAICDIRMSVTSILPDIPSSAILS